MDLDKLQREDLAASVSEILRTRKFDDLECCDLLHAGRAGYGYGFSALHLGLLDLFGP